MSIQPLARALPVLALGALMTQAVDENMRGKANGGDIIDIIGTEGWSRMPQSSGRPSGAGDLAPVGSSVEAVDDCPMMKYTYGEYSVIMQNCDGELAGTEFVPYYEDEEEVDVEADDPDAPAAAPQPITVTREDVQSLLVDAGGLTVQPDREWVLVHAETVAYTGATEQVLTTSVLDASIEVRVTPQRFTWSFDDGSAPLVSMDPGAPWPEHTVAHTYSTPQSGTTISVQTEWEAVFRIEGMSIWLPVAGTVVTNESSEPFDVVSAVPRLVTGQR